MSDAGKISSDQQGRRLNELIGKVVMQKYLLLLEIGFAHSQAIKLIVQQDFIKSPLYAEYEKEIKDKLLDVLEGDDVNLEDNKEKIKSDLYDQISEQFDTTEDNLCTLMYWYIILKLDYLGVEDYDADKIKPTCKYVFNKCLKDYDNFEI